MASVGRVREVLNLVALSALIPVGDELPREFRIFGAGENTSTKGSIVFDEHAARAVMAEFQQHGADIMIDLEHLSLEDPARSIHYDPDARGWAKLEIRNGELWAVDVHWTPEGEARLREKRQRYISPAFKFDPKSLRVTEVFNIAITALPATDQLAPLVAASRREKFNEGAPMNQEQLAAIAEALGLGADANVEDILATIAGMVKKIQDAANGAADAAGDAAEDAVEEGLPPEEQPAPMAAASRLRAAARKLARLSGKKEIGEVVCEVESWRASHLELEAEKAKLAKERALLEGSERRKLVGELVKLGAEIPATAWENADGKTPAKRFESEPLESLRDRVAKLSKVKAVAGGNTTNPPGTRGGKAEPAPDLTPEQLKICEQSGCKPEEFAALRKMFAAPVARS